MPLKGINTLCRGMGIARSIGCLDLPAKNECILGPMVVQGWALAPPGRRYELEIQIDGEPIEARLQRRPRPDVADRYPTLRANNPTPGFRAVVDAFFLPTGRHSVALVGRSSGQAKVLARTTVRVPYDTREFLAHRFLTGSGLEIGALSRPLSGPARCRVRYVDRMDILGLREHYPELSDQPLAPVDLIDDAETLQTVPPSSQDFIIVNHILEHTQDPIGTIERHLQRLKPGGVLYLTVPDKRFTFDAARPVTPLEHLYRDYEEGPGWSYLEHVREWVGSVKQLTGEAAEAEVQRTVATGYSIHFHVWGQQGFLEMLVDIRHRLRLPFDIEALMTEGVEIISILRKWRADEVE
jgi:hypothetical protein